MSILVPVYSTGVTMSEVPDHLAFYIEFGNCKQKCKGCHSPHLWESVEKETDINDLVTAASDAVSKGANAIVLMGGTTNGFSTAHLISLIDKLAEIAPVCLYSGSDDYELNLLIAMNTRLTWLKTGSYQETKGGLMSAETNQKFLRKENVNLGCVVFIDETYKFKI